MKPRKPKDSSAALSAELIRAAYALGMFPMAESALHEDVEWVMPAQRGIIPLESFRVPRRARRTLRASNYRVTFNRACSTVIRECALSTPRRPSTWINQQIIASYSELHRLGDVHSVETWLDDELVGGLYGTQCGGCFCGESMFSRRAEASTAALIALVWNLRRAGFAMLDTQFLTEHLQRFGAITISHREFSAMLSKVIDEHPIFEPYCPKLDVPSARGVCCTVCRAGADAAAQGCSPSSFAVSGWAQLLSQMS